MTHAYIYTTVRPHLKAHKIRVFRFQQFVYSVLNILFLVTEVYLNAIHITNTKHLMAFSHDPIVFFSREKRALWGKDVHDAYSSYYQ